MLCACDLLNEGWDSPKTEVLFMARPTMSKTLYIQQLGRGMRKCKGKDYLMVFDFIDNANMFNMPYSIHRLLNIKNYRPGQLVLAPDKQTEHDMNLLAQGEKPEVYLDFPVDITDYELIDLFNWQDEVKNMISQLEFVRMVDVQKETVERYIRDIFANPFRRFEDMRFVRRSRDIEYVEFNRHIFRKLSKEDVEWIKEHCNNKLEEYYKRNIS